MLNTILRITLVVLSVRYTAPAESTSTPSAILNCAVSELPSRYPPVPVPATGPLASLEPVPKPPIVITLPTPFTILFIIHIR